MGIAKNHLRSDTLVFFYTYNFTKLKTFGISFSKSENAYGIVW